MKKPVLPSTSPKKYTKNKMQALISYKHKFRCRKTKYNCDYYISKKQKRSLTFSLVLPNVTRKEIVATNKGTQFVNLVSNDVFHVRAQEIQLIAEFNISDRIDKRSKSFRWVTPQNEKRYTPAFVWAFALFLFSLCLTIENS